MSPFFAVGNHFGIISGSITIMRRTPLSVMFVLSAWAGYSQAIATINTPSGTFRGTSAISNLDQFLGIPYAEPPTRNLRFANPVPYITNASQTYDATKYGPGCSQDEAFAGPNGLSEDCLTLNIIKPCGNVAGLPVMFFIHGGGNMNGQSRYYNGTALVQHSITIEKPIIYVSINYRLAGFGFLNSPEFQKSGISNLGLKDQYTALQWVNKNIKSFGGNPDQVTIFGESSGAANVWSQAHFAYVKNESKKYFRGMITQSGAPGSPYYPTAVRPEEREAEYTRILVQTNCTGQDGISCLRNMPHEILAPLLVNYASNSYAIDQKWFSSDITSLLEKHEFVDIPLIHGTNLNEGSVFLPDPSNYPNRSALIDFVAPAVANTQTAAKIVDAYFASSDTDLGKGIISDPTAPHDFYVATAIYSDLYFDIGRRWLLDASSRRADTWGYTFRQQPPASALELNYTYPGLGAEFGKRAGVFHGAELPYVFGEVTGLQGRTQGDVDVAIAMMDAWISLAYTLSPTNDNGKVASLLVAAFMSYRHKSDSFVDPQALPWTKYGSGKSRKILAFEKQMDSKIGIVPDTQRAAVYRLWGKALRAVGQDPPF